MKDDCEAFLRFAIYGPLIPLLSRTQIYLITTLRACLHEGGGPYIGEVTLLGRVTKKPSFSCNLTTPPSWGALSQAVSKKNAGKPRVLVINALLHSLAAFAATLSAVAFYCYLK